MRTPSLALAVFLLAPLAAQEDAADLAKAKRERLKDYAADFWIYDDVEQGYAAAKKSGRPLLVTFRCVP